MKLQEFCDTLCGQFDKDRFDVSTKYDFFGRYERVVITITCRGCGMSFSEPVTSFGIEHKTEGYIFHIANMIRSHIRVRCGCWQPDTFVEPEKKKIKQKQSIRRKIRV